MQNLFYKAGTFPVVFGSLGQAFGATAHSGAVAAGVSL